MRQLETACEVEGGDEVVEVPAGLVVAVIGQALDDDFLNGAV
jgi:hypothetical protein